tara:strand:- start:6087 stop:7334 length:1248 start_codon:yes stop_codon:yes gene_type:complete
MTLLLMLALTVSVFAQKKELKVAEKSFKKQNYEAALEQLKVVEPLLVDADDKLKEKYYYIKAKSIYSDGKDGGNNKSAGLAFNELIAFEKETGLKKYLKEAEGTKDKIVKTFANSGSKLYNEKKYKNASYQFEMVYTLSQIDTSFLDNAALCAFYDKNYDRSINLYKKLLAISYTGISTQFRAKSIINGEYMTFSSKKDMDNQVMLKAAKFPEEILTESRAGDIAKNIALSYIAKGDEQAALDAIADAKKIFPNDYTLVISEANIYFKMGDNEKFLAGLRKAIELRPADPQLYYNVGVLVLEQGYTEKAIKAFSKAIELKPDYADAYNNVGVAILEKTKPIVEEMNNNLSNFKKYDQLMLKQKEVYKEALPYFEKSLELEPKSESKLSTLIGLYELLEMYDKQKATQAKLDAFQN